jgi:uncharacterized protein
MANEWEERAMRSAKVHESHGQATYILICEKGDEAIAELQRFAKEHSLSAAQFTAIGAFERATLAFFDWESKEYERIPVDEQTEVVALLGDIALLESGEPKVHAHAVLGRRNGSAVCGHVMDGHVRPTLEIVLTESPRHLQRRHDPATGLSLIRPQ